MLKSDKLPGMLRKTNQSPYVRRVAWVREIQRMLREHKTEQAGEVLKLLRKVGTYYDLLASFKSYLYFFFFKEKKKEMKFCQDTNVSDVFACCVFCFVVFYIE